MGSPRVKFVTDFIDPGHSQIYMKTEYRLHTQLESR